MAACTFFDQFKADIFKKIHNLATGSTDVVKAMLCLTAPVVTNSVKADLTEISAGNGYSAGGTTCGTITGAQTSGTFKLVLGTDPVFTASGGAIANFRYVVLYNDTPTSPADPLIAFFDYGSTVTVNNGESFTVDLDGSSGVFSLT